ncbi:MAG: PAS domain S-box protein, partial [Anaerolineales bacterium]|nr:PAS domain S-box protein [Anaerolineales bacterium]
MTLTSLSRLMTLRAILIRYFQFSSASSDTARRRNLLNIVLAMTVGLTLAAWGLSALEGDPFSAEYVLMVEAGLLLIGWLNNHRSNPAASLAFLLFLTGLLLTSDSPAEIVHGRTLPAFAVTVVLASVLLRAWAGFVFAGLNAGLVALTAFSVGLPVDAITLVVFIMVAGTTWLGVRMSEQAMAAQRALTQRLAEREAYYRAILENQGEGIGLVDAAERFLYANPAAHVIFGVPAGQLIGRSVLDFLRPTDAPLIQAQTDLRRQGRSSQYELDIQHPNGQSRRLLITATPQYDAAGRFLSTCGVFRDLTERLQLEAELQDSRARYRDLLETVEDWIWEIDLHERYTYASPRVRDMLGYEPAEIVGRTPYDFMATPAEADRVRALIHTWQSGAAALTSVENTCRHRTGRLVVVETSLRPFYNAAGQLRGYRGVDRDVTARKRAEDALRASEARFARAFQTIPDAITIIRQRDMQFLEVNAGFTQLTGFAAGEVRGRSVAEFNLWSRPDTDLAQVRQALRQHGEVKGLELLFRRKDGAERVGLLTVAGLDLEGEASLVGILRDVTDWRQAEQALQKRTEELELLYEAGTRLGSTLDLEAVAEVTHDTIARFMDCPDLYVSRYDPSTQLIHCVHARRFGQRLAPGSFPPIPLEPEGHGTQSIAIRTGETLRLGDYPDYFRTARTRYRISDTGHLQPAQDSDSDEVAASALIVPLKMGGQVHGVIQVFSYTPDAYTLAQQRILEALAPQMAAALANALLYQQAQRELQERQRAETEVRRAYVEKERLVAAIASILIGLDARDQVTQWNAAAETVLGRPAAAALGQPLEALGLNWEWEALREAITACRRTAQPTRVRALQFQPAAGLTRMLGLTVTPLPFEAEPEAFGVLILGSDITERLNLERQLVQAQKLESIGQLAAGVAHEIN